MSITIRPFYPEDLNAICQIEKDTFGNLAYPPFFFRQVHDALGDLFLVAESDGETVGYILGSLQSGSKKGWILSLAVKKENRRRGIAKMLIEDILSTLSRMGAKSVFLTVEPDKKELLSWYRKLDFHEIRLIENYCGDGKPRIVMRKNL